MGERASVSYVCKSCNSIFFHESDVAAHRASTGHNQFEKKGEPQQEDEYRMELYRQLEGFGIPSKPFDALPDGALQELLYALKKAKGMYRDGR